MTSRYAVLEEAAWHARAAAHRERVGRFTDPHRDRQRRGETHPVLDFLFTYYPYRPAKLERWLPGPAVVLRGDTHAFGQLQGFAYDEQRHGVRLDPAALPDQVRARAHAVRTLLQATATRPARLGCFGLHEWAMVYRTSDRRHGAVPLRLGADGTDEVVESLSVRCSHFDAYRFFTPAARPRNALTPTRAEQAEYEQPGCLHATMDLYKWAMTLAPVTPSELVADCFELAIEVREIDMRASPYDLSAYGYSPIAIETSAGRAQYVRRQDHFARRAAPLRERLIDVCDVVLEAAEREATRDWMDEFEGRRASGAA